MHEPEVQCIAKGKAGKKYEFGNKVSLAVTSKKSWVIGALSFEGNPYDGHTLSKQIEQVRSIVGAQSPQGNGGQCDQCVDERRR